MIRNLLAGIGCLTVAVVLSAMAWLYRAELQDWWRGFTGEEVVAVEPSPELADRAAAKIESLTEGAPSDEDVRFSELELQSLVEYRLADRFPEGVYNPRVALVDSTVELTVDLDLERLSTASGAAGNLRRLIGDSTRVQAELRPAIPSPGVGELTVVRLQAGAVPVPPMFIPSMLSQAGFPTRGGSAVTFAIPRDVRAVRIEGDTLVLDRDLDAGEG